MTEAPAVKTTTATPGGQQLTEPLRSWARGIHPVAAAVELLIAHATFLNRSDFRDQFIDTSTASAAGLASINWTSAITALDTGNLPCSGGEQCILRLAASIADGIPVNLRDTLTRIDASTAALLSRAIMHAGGHLPSSRTLNVTNKTK